MIFVSLAEVVSLGAVLPFLAALTAPDKLFKAESIQPLIKLLGITTPYELLYPITLIFCLSALISGVMRITLVWFENRLSSSIGANLSLQIYRNTLYQPYITHVSRNSSEVISGVSGKANAIVAYIIMPGLNLLSSLLILIAILTALLVIDTNIAIYAFGGFGLIYLLVILITNSKLERDSKRISYEQPRVVKAMNEGLGGIRDVLIDGTQSFYCDVFEASDLPLRRAMANVQIMGGVPRYGVEALGMILIGILAYSMSGRDANLSTAIPILGALALGAQRLLPVMQQGYSSFSAMRGGKASLVEGLALLDQSIPEYWLKPAAKKLTFHKEIRLKELCYRYSNDGPIVLENLSLTITKGSIIGLIGKTGSGKSSLLDILMGLLVPTSGEILVDSVTINLINIREWQSNIAHVPQSIFLADTSVAENIAFGVPASLIDMARVRDSAKKAQISEVIEQFNNGYETKVGENGVKLSGGMRQRIGIARAFYKQANLIILDEATSALDNGTEMDVMEGFQNLDNNLTIVIVAHRLSTLINCSAIYEINNKHLIKYDSYSQLMQARQVSQ